MKSNTPARRQSSTWPAIRPVSRLKPRTARNRQTSAFIHPPRGVQRSLVRETIANAAHGLDESIEAMGGQGPAQAADMDVDRPLPDEAILPPALLQQLGAAVYPLGMGDEEMQQAGFRGTYVHLGALCGDPVGDRVQVETPEF